MLILKRFIQLSSPTGDLSQVTKFLKVNTEGKEKTRRSSRVA